MKLGCVSLERLKMTHVNNNGLPKVLLTITCYNYEQFVGEAIESALNQTYKNLDVVVINDGSTDGSLDVIRNYQDKVKIINRKNKGIVFTRNEAISLAVGNSQYLCFLDADDYFDSNYISDMVQIAERTNADVVYPNWHIFGDKDEKIKFSDFDIQKLIKHEIHCTAESLIRVKAIGQNRFENEGVAEDWDFFLGLAFKGKKFVLAKKCFINYRVRQNTRGSSRDYWDDMRYFYQILQKWHKKYPERVDPIDLPLAIGRKRDEFITEQGKIIDNLQDKLKASGDKIEVLNKEISLQRKSILKLNTAISDIQQSKAYRFATKLAAIKNQLKAN